MAKNHSTKTAVTGRKVAGPARKSKWNGGRRLRSASFPERVRNGLLLGDELAADFNAATRVRSLTSCFARRGDLSTLLEEVLQAAIEVTGADFGNIQLLDPTVGGLRIVAQQGFCAEFLEYFDHVHEGQAVCGAAMKARQRVLVEDVTDSRLFRDARTIEVMLRAGVRAVQSTPLTGRSGELLGMISTHYRVPGQPSEREFRVLDMIARLAGGFIEWKALNPMHEARVATQEPAQVPEPA